MPGLCVAVVLLAIACGVLLIRNRRLEAMATIDPLTGLPNRRGLQRAWRRLPGNRALLFVDLDGFKAINDAYGHAVGDALLRQVARRLADAVSRPGLLARWGGDEFVAVVPAGHEGIDARALHDCMIRAYDLPGAPAPHKVQLGMSIGICAGAASFERAVEAAAAHLLDARASRPARRERA